MDDERTAPRPPARQAGRTQRPAAGQTAANADFDEETYLKFNPDVRAAVAGGVFASGREHFERFGRAEGRAYKMLDSGSRNRVVVTGATMRPAPKPPACGVETIRLSSSGGILMIGWANDTADPLDSVDLYFMGWAVSFDAKTLARPRRLDVEAALGSPGRHGYGFWGFLYAGAALPGGQCSAVVRLKSGAEIGFSLNAETVTDGELRKITLGYLATNIFLGNPAFAPAAAVAGGIAGQIAALNRAVIRQVTAAPYVQRFGAQRARYRGSFIICLYGRAEYMFLQNAAFAAQAGMQDYEMIYICNSPHLGEALLAEAALCTRIYGIDLTVILLSGNAGFGAANNAAARHCRSDRLMFINPDVFPKDLDWITRHGALLAGLPAAKTELFGAPLYYDNGSLMHGGMYYELEQAPEFPPLLRVLHYGKGAPPDAPEFLAARPVPGVSGAFMSINRSWFDKLGGFNEDYSFGHYEDADFCLKSLTQGVAPWLHDIGLWHLESSGGDRLHQHDGGAMVNRWLFTAAWREIVARDLAGPGPAPAPLQRRAGA